MRRFDSCLRCFSPLRGYEVCARCGYDQADKKRRSECLPSFTALNGRYLLGMVLGRGGFGVTYAALDIQTNRRCAIKEYFPADYSVREKNTKHIVCKEAEKAKQVFSVGRDRFLEEAKTILRFRSNPLIVDVWGFFRENNTAYIVMEFVDGQDLEEFKKSREGRLELPLTVRMTRTLSSTLVGMHRKGVLHRDIKPANIMLTRSGSFKLCDFGSARDYVRAQRLGEAMSVLISPGFSPPEQYRKNGNQGPWTDVYALCATFYYLVSGKKPVDSYGRMRGVRVTSLYEQHCGVSRPLSDVIERGMALDIPQRFADFERFLKAFDAATAMPVGTRRTSIKT